MKSDSKDRRDEYRQLGFTVIRGVIPPTLLERLREQAEVASVLIRAKYGPQVQRLQAVYDYEELDQGVFDEYYALPILREHVQWILGEGFESTGFMGIFFEPVVRPWCTAWHRDWFDTPTVDVEEFYDAASNHLEMFSQANAALYRDTSLWVVPGSHRRRDTSPEERFALERPALPPALLGNTAAEMEAECVRIVESMPSATRVVLEAGDVTLYRNSGWHLGFYVPYAQRATLHDGFFGEADRRWWSKYGWRARARVIGIT